MMRPGLYLLVLLIYFVSVSVFANSAIDPEALKSFEVGVKYHDQGDLRRAARAYHAALQQDPGLVSAAINLGIVYEKWHQNANAGKLYNEAVRVAPNSFAARYNRAQFLQKRGDLAAARVDYNKALSLSPNEPSIYINVAALEIRLFELNQDAALLAAAERNLRHAERLKSRSPALYFNKAQLFEHMNFPARARLSYQEAMRHFPQKSAEYITCTQRAERLSRQLSHN
jgi:Tfp pilus assembly protein PilF